METVKLSDLPFIKDSSSSGENLGEVCIGLFPCYWVGEKLLLLVSFLINPFLPDLSLLLHLLAQLLGISQFFFTHKVWGGDHQEGWVAHCTSSCLLSFHEPTPRWESPRLNSILLWKVSAAFFLCICAVTCLIYEHIFRYFSTFSSVAFPFRKPFPGSSRP